jgi:prepilin-type N-terminal cleavage/methylation domain-containing protein/prepilin-type processing-associated H-X9-DG protein
MIRISPSLFLSAAGRPSRRGFTLIELLVVIAIIGLLMAIALPVINSSRGTARRIQCQNNQRQVGFGLLSYINQYNAFPKAATYGEKAGLSTPAQVGTSIINNAFTGASATFGTFTPGTATTADVGPLYSWVVNILPFLDEQAKYNDFNRNRVYFDGGRAGDDTSRPTNLTISSTSIGSLACPEDPTLILGQGNLSYVVNGGFSRWHGVAYGWTGASTGGATGPTLDWTALGVPKKTGVMFLGTAAGQTAWDYNPTAGSISDGLSTTILVSENHLAGASPGNAFSGNTVTNWATAHPNFMMFVASDDVCSSGTGKCLTSGDLGGLAGKTDGAGWARGNQSGKYENINGGNSSTDEGSSPYPNSKHSGGVVVTMCDGSVRFIRGDVAGTVWSKLITPAGQQLPAAFNQMPLASDAD